MVPKYTGFEGWIKGLPDSGRFPAGGLSSDNDAPYIPPATTTLIHPDMKLPPFRSALVLLLDIGLAAVCALHIPALEHRARAPLEPSAENGAVVLYRITDSSAAGDLRQGDRLISWNGEALTIPATVELFSDRGNIGDPVSVTVERSGREIQTVMHLIPAMTGIAMIITLLTGIVTWCAGVFILLARPRDRTAAVLHWCMISMAVVVVIGFEGLVPGNILGYASSALFFVSYAAIASTFFLFTTLFPRPKAGRSIWKLLLTYPPVIALTGLMLYHHWRAIVLPSVEEFAAYRVWFDVFHVVLLLYVAGGLANLGHSLAHAASSEERRKIRWLLWGLTLGVSPFLLLTVLPQALGVPAVLQEAYTLGFLALIPVAFAISIARHHLLDIDLVISRTTAYAVVIGIAVAVYALIVGATAGIIGSRPGLLPAVAAVAIALLFEPLRKRAQRLVDRRFFRVRYNYRMVQRTLTEQIRLAFDLPALARSFLDSLEGVMPLERSGVFAVEQPGNRAVAVDCRGFDGPDPCGFPPAVAHAWAHLRLPMAVDGAIEAGTPHVPAEIPFMNEHGIALVIPVLHGEQDVVGLVIVGPKKSARRFSQEDVDLLTAACTQAGLAIQRIRLQRALVLQQAERDRLADLNELKSDFVSSVSHELRTPLTSIRMFTELLQQARRKPDRQSIEYLAIIEGETDRLDRMVGTILDSARINRGLKEYTLTETDLAGVTRRVVQIMGYQLTTQGFRVDVRTGRHPLMIQADGDAVAQAIINLISNAIKYSADRKTLGVSVRKSGDHALCVVRDRGVGIGPEALPHIFEKFYRGADRQPGTRGVGLGLPLVRHIMEAHGGTVAVESVSGRGSTFTLAFPLFTHPKRKA
jgi:signal transduction histidine kinase